MGEEEGERREMKKEYFYLDGLKLSRDDIYSSVFIVKNDLKKKDVIEKVIKKINQLDIKATVHISKGGYGASFEIKRDSIKKRIHGHGSGAEVIYKKVEDSNISEIVKRIRNGQAYCPCIELETNPKDPKFSNKKTDKLIQKAQRKFEKRKEVELNEYDKEENIEIISVGG